MTDEEHAEAVRNALAALNLINRQAAKAGLKVELTVGDETPLDSRPYPSVTAHIYRPL